MPRSRTPPRNNKRRNNNPNYDLLKIILIFIIFIIINAILIYFSKENDIWRKNIDDNDFFEFDDF
jgi:hypothetical protein